MESAAAIQLWCFAVVKVVTAINDSDYCNGKICSNTRHQRKNRTVKWKNGKSQKCNKKVYKAQNLNKTGYHYFLKILWNILLYFKILLITLKICKFFISDILHL